MRDRRKRKPMATDKPAPPQIPTLEEIVKKVSAAFSEIAPDAIRRLTESELRAKRAEDNYAFLKEKLLAILTPDQIEAAKYCDIDPALYAINWIELLLKKQISLDGAIRVQTLRELHGG